jgi:very-short-patch-repair endonuclease
MNWSEKDLARYRNKGADAVRKPKKRTSSQKPASELEVLFDLQMRTDKLPAGVMNYYFMEERKFNFDRAYPDHKVAIEIDGMVHRIKDRFERDIEKFALATLLGWTVLRVSGKTIREGRAIIWVKQLLRQKGIIE